MPILDTIMLIDDNPADNYYHRLIIEEMDVASTILEFETAYDALEYLNISHEHIINMIFLDINMPLQDGFAFLAEYTQIEVALKSAIIVVILTNSLSEQDRKKAEQSATVDHYLIKPLTVEDIETLITTYFLDL